MKVNHVTDRNDNSQANSLLDSDEKERTGVELGEWAAGGGGEYGLVGRPVGGLGFHLYSCNIFSALVTMYVILNNIWLCRAPRSDPAPTADG